LVNNVYVIEFKVPQGTWVLLGSEGFFPSKEEAQEDVRALDNQEFYKDKPLKYRVAKFKRAD
jgi:hypothetical protein